MSKEMYQLKKTNIFFNYVEEWNDDTEAMKGKRK